MYGTKLPRTPAGRKQRLLELATTANEQHLLCVGAFQKAIEHACAAGKALNQARRLVSHGEWGSWVKQHFQGSHRSANNYMKIARYWNQILGETFAGHANLTIEMALRFASAAARRQRVAPASVGTVSTTGGVVVNRAQVAEHLRRLAVNGVIREAVLDEKLGAVARTADEQLGISVPQLQGIEPLPRGLNVPDLDRLLRALMPRADEDDFAEIVVGESFARVVHNGYSVEIATPDILKTRFRVETFDKLSGVFTDGRPISISSAWVQRYLNVREMLGSEYATISLGRKAGAIAMNHERATGRIRITSSAVGEPVTVTVNAKLLAQILTLTKDGYPWAMHASNEVIAFERMGGYRYILSGMEAMESAEVIQTDHREGEEVATL